MKYPGVSQPEVTVSPDTWLNHEKGHLSPDNSPTKSIFYTTANKVKPVLSDHCLK